jgi:hypothetical protein
MGVTPEKGRLFAYGFGLVLLGTVFWTGIPLLTRHGVLKAYAKKPDRELAVTYEISGERLSCRSDVASSDMLWKIILKALRTADGFLLYISDTQIHWLPVHGFENAAEIDRLATLAKEKVQDYNDER